MSAFLSTCVNIGLALVMLAILLSFIRLARGPSLADRVVALDMMTVSIVAFCGLSSLQTGLPVFLDVALVLALVGFLATVALARYAERALLRRQGDITADNDPFTSVDSSEDETAESKDGDPS